MATKYSQFAIASSINQSDWLTGYVNGGSNFRIQKSNLSFLSAQISDFNTAADARISNARNAVNGVVALNNRAIWLNGYALYMTDSVTKNYIGYGANTGLLPKDWGVAGVVAGGTDGGALIQTFTDEIVARWTAASRFYTCNETHIKLAEAQTAEFLKEFEISPWYDKTNNYLKIRTRLADVSNVQFHTNNPNIALGKIASSGCIVTGDDAPAASADFPNGIFMYNKQADSAKQAYAYTIMSGPTTGIVTGIQGKNASYANFLSHAPVIFNDGTQEWEFDNFVLFTGIKLDDDSSSYAYKQTGQWTNSSDSRIKENPENLDTAAALNAINKLRPLHFDWKDKYLEQTKQKKARQTNYYADDIENIEEFNRCVTKTKRHGFDDFRELDPYIIHGPYLVAAVQELSKRIERLESFR